MAYQTRKKLAWAGLFLSTFIFYSLNVSDDFLWDDQYFIGINNFFNSCASITGYFQLNPFVVDPLPMLSRPLTAVSLILNKCLFPSPLAFKFANIFIHSSNAVLLFFCLLSLGGRLGVSLLLSAFFAFSPVALDLVNISTFRNHLFSCFFLLSALLLSFRTKKMSPWLIPLYLLALASGENAFFLFIPFLLLLKLLGGKKFLFSGRILTALLVISAVFLVYRIPRGHYKANSGLEFISKNTFYTASGREAEKIPAEEAAVSAIGPRTFSVSAGIFARYLGFLLVPVGEFNSRPSAPASSAKAFFLLLLLPAFAALSLWTLKKREFMGFGLSLFLLSLGVYMNLFFAVENPQANRYLYVPLIFAVFVFHSVCEKFRLSVWLFALLAGFNFFSSFHYAPFYRSNFSFFSLMESHGAKDAKLSSAMYYEYLRMKNHEKALGEVAKLGELEIKNKRQTVLFLETLAYAAWNKPEKAGERLEKLSLLEFDKAIIYNLRALTEIKAGRREEAKKLLEKSLKLNPRLKESRILAALLEEGTLLVSPKDGLSLSIINFYLDLGVRPSIKVQLQE